MQLNNASPVIGTASRLSILRRDNGWPCNLSAIKGHHALLTDSPTRLIAVIFFICVRKCEAKYHHTYEIVKELSWNEEKKKHETEDNAFLWLEVTIITCQRYSDVSTPPARLPGILASWLPSHTPLRKKIIMYSRTPPQTSGGMYTLRCRSINA